LGPEKYPWFSGFASQRLWLAALLALRHWGAEQYFVSFRQACVNWLKKDVTIGYPAI